MGPGAKKTLVEVVVIIVGVILVMSCWIVISAPGGGTEMTRAVCMGNLGSINKALVLYKSANNDQWPWMIDSMTEWDTTKVATNRNVDPYGKDADPNNPKARSITALMFMLVRTDQAPGIFRCPGDRDSITDDGVKAAEEDGDIKEGEYYWDFTKPENVSFSWQAPIWKDSQFRQGIGQAEPNTVIVADMTPAATDPQWKPSDVSTLSNKNVLSQMSRNHQKDRQVNVLYAAGYVKPEKRPEAGQDKDNIYTASGLPGAGSQSATSLDIKKHLSTRDTFLIGPVGRNEATDK